jgi:prepilin peptidase CpaA
MLQPTCNNVVMAAVAGGGGVGAVIDLQTRRVPNVLTFGVAALGLMLAATGRGSVSLPLATAGLVLGLLLMLPGHLIGATGAGDVKLFAAIGALLGPKTIAVAFIYTAIAGGLLAAIVAVNRRSLGHTVERAAALVATRGANVEEIERPSTNNRFAYAPAIALGTILAALGL